MTCYVDLYTEPSNLDDAVGIVKYAKKLGFCLIGMKPVGEWEKISSIARDAGVKLVKIEVLEGSTRKEIARKAMNIPRGTLLLVKAINQEVARYAGANKRYAGIIVVPGLERIVDKSTRNLFRERGWGIAVIILRYLLGKRSRSTWRYYYLSLRRGFAYGIDLSLASGARNAEELWHPMSAAGLAEIVGVPGEYALSWLSTSPAKLLESYQR